VLVHSGEHGDCERARPHVERCGAQRPGPQQAQPRPQESRGHIGGLSRAQVGVLRAYRGGWNWSPYMPKCEGSSTTPRAFRYRVPMAALPEDVYNGGGGGQSTLRSCAPLSSPFAPVSTMLHGSSVVACVP
jgi:hypothetical protein